MTKKLKPCPFCGSEDITFVDEKIPEEFLAPYSDIFEALHIENAEKRIFICNNCTAAVAFQTPIQLLFFDKDTTNHLWNRRASDGEG